MTTRERLQTFHTLTKEIDALSRAINKERRDVESLSRRIQNLIDKRNAEREHVLERIANLESPLHRTVLIEKYINGRTVVAISMTIHYSESRTYEIIKEAEEKLEL